MYTQYVLTLDAEGVIAYHFRRFSYVRKHEFGVHDDRVTTGGLSKFVTI